jgi:SNF2 family DNA or RNA helicase
MGWFKLEGRVNISADVQWSVAETIQKMEEGEGKYIRVDDHTFVRISKELRKIVTRLRAISKKMPDDHNFEVPAFAVATLDDSFDDVITTNSYDAVALRKKVKSCATWHAAVPETLNGELKPYQEIGYQWMARTLSWGAGVCLADDMGLGKTIQTIALLLLKASEGPSLVVAPTSVVFNWRNELQRFAPSLHVLVLNGADDRKEMVDEAVAGDVVVASYGMLFSQEPILTQKQWNVACLDEAHAIKNRTTKTAQAAMHLMAENRIVLTGTPVQNHFTDLWSLFHFINPGLLGNYQSFTERFSDEQNIEDCKSLAEELKGTVSPFILRRTKDEVLDELPGIDENIRYVELSPEELVIYDATRMAVKKKFEEKSRYDIYRRLSATGSQNVEVLAMLTKLRELACSNSLLIQGWQKRSSKEEAFMDLLHEIDLSYNHVLVFSQFTCFLQEIKDMLDEEGIDFLYLDGATPMKQREHLIDAFQSGATPIFLISLKAGGVGLNLTQASYVIHLDPWWNPAIEQQATDRAYRIGQNQHVSVFHLICRHTIEEKVLALQERKQAMSDTLLDTNGRSQGLSRDDILELLSD